MASVPVYCLCRLPYDVTRFMIECDACQDWFHGSCVGVEEDMAAEIDLYHCPNCQVLHGPSVMKRRRGPQRQPDGTLGRDAGRAVRTGSAQFIKELRSRTFPSADEILLRPSGSQLTVEYLEENSFSVPILVAKKDGLGMTLPPPTFTAHDIEHYVGADKEIDVIDVARQAGCRMRLGDFVDYFCGAARDKVLNVISLEFSDTRLSNLVETPRLVRKLSWVENLWPGEAVFERPSVQKYCLLGARGSYTDWHVDCGGTSVWYHVLRGEKIFYLVRPTLANLALFETWSSSSSQSETFFGDQADRCYRCPLRQGQTLFIPTGWIHAVLTPVDCLAFGGNFLHSLNIEMQLKAYEIERRLSTADLFRFPNFETICWYVGKHLLDTFRGLRENRRHPATYLLHGAKALATAFRSWTRKEVLAEHEDEIPSTVRPAQLIKDLAKEIRLAEDLLQQSLGKGGSPFGVGRGPPLATLSAPLPARWADPTSQDGAKEGGRKGALPGPPQHLELPDAPGSEEGDPPSSSLEETDPESEPPEADDGDLVLANGRTPRTKRTQASRRWQPRSCSPPSPPGLDLDSEEDLQIDEAPPPHERQALGFPQRLPKFPRKLPRAKPCSDPNRVREPGEVEFDIEEDYTTEEEEEGAELEDPEGGASAAGLLDLLKASRQVGGADYDALSEPPASPSTQEAIQGMLRMANLPGAGPAPSTASLQAWWAGGGPERGPPKRPPRHPPKRPASRSSESEDEAPSPDEHDSLGACFKDAEYIYPSLESDEDDPALKSLPKKKKSTDDAPWSPKARVTPTLPRQARPVREGTRVASVETGLAAAAAKLAQQEHQRLQRRRNLAGAQHRTPSPQDTEPEPEPEPEAEPAPPEPPPVPIPTPPVPASLADHEYTVRPGGLGPMLPARPSPPMAPGVFLSQRRAPAGTPAALPCQGKRPKKGLATAKQRLGRILKIHRNGKLLL
ncbi:histone lysine demethylase PHF8 isoform X1 [Alligator mississippiensis]|uniref:Lysine-specific demethylase 7A isoform C n=2 Tax=Alligator mississippiensis TaxID=8496 RepID=A0A151NQH6_ALLMI|nr:histone lysine demethylase PHF8 isoform X1 [Alligator mississippiensis]KYO38899.1 lysine-specific demethylase 7A isoform C [Alligator mississippiensis]